MTAQIVLLGRGGQGVTFAARVLGEAAMDAGQDVLCAETHGMAQRGGSVVSFVKLGAFASPLVRRGAADIAICFAASEAAAAQSWLREHGTFVHDAPDGRVAAALARDAGAPKSATAALLGLASGRAPGLIPPVPAIRAALARLARPRARDAALAAFDAGVEAAGRAGGNRAPEQ